ncbi:MAG: HTH domain-containing protein [Patescibacteria group bacterium]
MLEIRQKELLGELVKSYIKQAEPVGSKHLEKKLGVSSATIRNEMASLEEEGYLIQPHTSSGRIPTAKAYQYYVCNFLEPKDPRQTEQKALNKLQKDMVGDFNSYLKSLAKIMAEFSGQAVVVGFDHNNVYYTGLSNLFSQPEFSHIDMVQSMSKIIDHLDEAMSKFYKTLADKVEIRIGNNNPFGNECATVITSYNWPRQKNIIGFLGPWRMDYESNVGRLNYVRKYIN